MRLITVAFGMGVDSMAMLIGMHHRGIRPDVITFAMTGSEKRATYEYVPHALKWLKAVDFPGLTVVFKRVKRFKYGPYQTLEGNCLRNRTLPSISFLFRKGCSIKWKAEPQEAYLTRHWGPGIGSLLDGPKMRRFIGYDAGPKDARRGGVGASDAFDYEYPLREWGWDREKCKEIILAEGLPLPPKSACYFCAVSKPEELLALAESDPDLLGRAILMERNAQDNLDKIEGLWAMEGKMGKDSAGRPLPGKWETFLRDELGMLRFTDIEVLGQTSSAAEYEFVGERLMPEPTSKEKPSPYLEVWQYA